MSWVVCQIGAREHYAIPRALAGRGELAALVTDFWVSPSSPLAQVKRLGGRWHEELAEERVEAFNLRMLAFEALRKKGWEGIMARNSLFQKRALSSLSALKGEQTLFSYSYAARDLFREAKSRGWRCVLGQIDPGPEEERVVQAEHERYPELGSSWEVAPSRYWEEWREEVELADSILVNSEWSRTCLMKEGVAAEKIVIQPLAYSASGEVRKKEFTSFCKVLFLGQVNLRKGVGRLLDAMRLLKDEEIELVLAGPSEIDSSHWSDLPKVTSLGAIPRNEVDAVYQDADLFILPTLSDGFAITQLEAEARGLPLLVSQHCGQVVREGENGWVLSDLEPETIAEALRNAARSLPLPVRPSLSEEFTIDALASALLK